jgi:hypothetical protein
LKVKKGFSFRNREAENTVSTGIEYSCQITLAFTSPNARAKTELSGVTVPGLFTFLFGTKLEVIYLIIQIPKAFERYGGYYRFRNTKGLNSKLLLGEYEAVLLM